MDQFIKVQVYLPDGEKADSIIVTKNTSIRTILSYTNVDDEIVAFIGSPDDDNSIILENLDMTLEEVNICAPDKSYIVEISIYNVLDATKYNTDDCNFVMMF